MTPAPYTSKAHIVATVGPATTDVQLLAEMMRHGMDLARLNFSWGDLPSHAERIRVIREAAKVAGKHVPIVQDLPGPRIQTGKDHTYDPHIDVVTDEDEKYIEFGAQQKLEYTAVSFVGSAKDVLKAKELIKKYNGGQKVIAKIERKVAVENMDEIIAAADAVMIARGDLGSELPLERIPFVQADILRRCKKADKPVITATQMMTSMVANPAPVRADVTDVAYAIIEGSDAVMLSEETAIGKYPLEVIKIMEKIIGEAEQSLGSELHINTF